MSHSEHTVAVIGTRTVRRLCLENVIQRQFGSLHDLPKTVGMNMLGFIVGVGGGGLKNTTGGLTGTLVNCWRSIILSLTVLSKPDCLSSTSFVSCLILFISVFIFETFLKEVML